MNSLIAMLARPRLFAGLAAATSAAAAHAAARGQPLAVWDGDGLVLLYADGRVVPMAPIERTDDEQR